MNIELFKFLINLILIRNKCCEKQCQYYINNTRFTSLFSKLKSCFFLCFAKVFTKNSPENGTCYMMKGPHNCLGLRPQTLCSSKLLIQPEINYTRLQKVYIDDWLMD